MQLEKNNLQSIHIFKSWLDHMNEISLDEATMAFQRSSLDLYCLPLAWIAALIKDDPDVSQVDLRLDMAWRSGWILLFSHTLLEQSSGTYGVKSYGAWRPAWPCIKTSFSRIYVWLPLVRLVIGGTEGNLDQINALTFSDISE